MFPSGQVCSYSLRFAGTTQPRSQPGRLRCTRNASSSLGRVIAQIFSKRSTAAVLVLQREMMALKLAGESHSWLFQRHCLDILPRALSRIGASGPLVLVMEAFRQFLLNLSRSVGAFGWLRVVFDTDVIHCGGRAAERLQTDVADEGRVSHSLSSLAVP